MAYITDFTQFERRTKVFIQIGDYVRYYDHWGGKDKGSRFMVVNFRENFQGDRILVLNNGKTIHPCYMELDIKYTRKLKLNKICQKK